MSFWFGGGAAAQEDAKEAPIPVARDLYELSQTGRYRRLAKPDGGVVHLLGVTPCSTLSAGEVALLLGSVKPAGVYVDMPPEYVEELQGEMALTPDGRMQLPGAEWPSFNFRWDRGWAASMSEHTQRSPREFAALAGLDYYAPVREALRFVAKHPATSLMTFPFSVTEKYDDAYEALRRVVSLELDMAAPQGEFLNARSNTVRLVLYPSMAKALATVEVTLPPSDYFNTDQLRELREAAQRQVDAAAAVVTPEEWDGSGQLIAALKEMHGEDFNPANPPDMASQVLVNSLEYHEKQARSVAFSLQSAPGQDIVAVVDASRVACYEGEWDRATSPAAMFPERSLGTFGVKWGLIGTGVGAVGWAYQHLARRFPKSTIGFTAVGAVWGAAAWWEMANQVPMVCGSNVRRALARPVAPIGANLNLGGGK